MSTQCLIILRSRGITPNLVSEVTGTHLVLESFPFHTSSQLQDHHKFIILVLFLALSHLLHSSNSLALTFIISQPKHRPPFLHSCSLPVLAALIYITRMACPPQTLISSLPPIVVVLTLWLVNHFITGIRSKFEWFMPVFL